MSLTEIKGTALGTKMGVVTTVKPTVTATPIKSLIKATTSPVTKISPIAQAITVKTVTSVPTALKSSVTPTATATKTASVFDYLNAVIGIGAEIVPQVANQVIGVASTGVPKAVATIFNNPFGVATKVSTNPTTINPTLSPAQQSAIDVSRNQRMTSFLNANPTVSNLLVALRTTKTLTDVQKAGNVIIPSSALTEQQNALLQYSAQYSALQGSYAEQQSSLSDYYNRLQTAMQELQLGTQQGAIYKAQLENVTQKYEELLKNPPSGSGGLDIFGSIADALKGVLPYLAIGIVAIIGIFVLSRSKD
jgi:hypothetical protein